MRDFKIYITIGCLLLVVYVLIEYNKPKAVNWQPTLSYNDKIPFGTYIFYHQLNDIFPKAQVVNTNQSIYSVFSKPLPAGNYIIVAKEVKMTKYDFAALIKYIKAGNNIFIAGFSWNGAFKDSLKIETREEYSKEKVSLCFTSPQLKKDSSYKFDKDIGSQYFSKFDTAHATVISKNKANEAVYLSYKFGKGALLLCANPQLFSNYSLLTELGSNYAQRAISYLPASKKIYWDEYQNNDVVVNTSPMRVFLSSPGLQWAYYLSLFTLVIYILFEIKRRQRIIPIIEPLKNSTVDFVSVVGRVYFEKRDNANIAGKKIMYLLGYLREQYMLKTNKLDSEFIDNLYHKTGVTPGFARNLVDHVNYVNQQTKVTDHELIVLNQLIEEFYSKS